MTFIHLSLRFSRSRQSLKVREHKVLGPYVDGLSQLAVMSFEVRLPAFGRHSSQNPPGVAFKSFVFHIFTDMIHNSLDLVSHPLLSAHRFAVAPSTVL